MHGRHIGEHSGKLSLDDLKADERLVKLDALLCISERDLVGSDSMTNRLPGYTRARSCEHERRVLEAA